ncbi:MAG: tetratricopeptide repeat protein [Gammaproteobacteria bacterium]
MKFTHCLIVAALAGALAAGCDRQPQAWEEASTEDTVAAYDAYLENYPEGEHAAEARARRDTLAETQAWEEAQAADTPEAYEAYLADHESGAHAADARDKVAEASADSDWKAARSANSAQAYNEYASNHPDDARAAEARIMSRILDGIEEGRPRDIGRTRARIVSMEGGEIVVYTLNAVRLGSLTVPPREMTFNVESSVVEGAPEPEVGDMVTLYLSESPGGEKGEPRVVGVLATPAPLAEADTETAAPETETDPDSQ